MTRSRLGKSKRLAAFLCALLLTLETVAFPLTQAKAAATAALATVGFGVTAAAFLAACGIYPYWANDSPAVNFDWEDWVDDDLMSLVDQYNAANSTTPVNPNQVSAFLSGATLLVGNYAWNKLCNFAEWIKTEYAVTDNQTNVEIGVNESPFLRLPYISNPTVQSVSANGFLAVTNYSTWSGDVDLRSEYISAYSADVPMYVFRISGWQEAGDGECLVVMPIENQPYTGRFIWCAMMYYDTEYDEPELVFDVAHGDFYYNDVKYNITSYEAVYGNLSQVPPLYDTIEDAMAAYFGGEGEFQGITADTSTISVPDALPEGTEYGGLRVSGLPAATTAESVTDAVQDSVGERLKTPVEVVEVELAPGTEVDSETGAITQNPVIIEAPAEETIPALSALVPAQEFLSALSETMQTKFPFCLPFDFMRVLQAFAKSPDAPVITMTFFDRIGGGNYTVTVDLSPWDDVAAVVRRLESMILFLGFWLNFDKFNVLNIILGQIG